MKRILLLIMSFVIATALTACAKKSSHGTEDSAASGAVQNQSTVIKGEAQNDEKAKEINTNYMENINDARKIIYNASASIDVKNLKNAYDMVVKKSQDFGGYVSNSNFSEVSSQIVVRIPSQKLREFLDYLKTLGEYKNESISTDDITDQYTDTESRLKNLRAQEEQLLTILKKAKTVDEVLKVQTEISKVREDIEVMEGRINMWDKLMEMSTITVMVNKLPEVAGKDVKISFVGFTEIGKNIANGFKSTLNFVIKLISSIIVIIVSIIPMIPFIAIAAWIIIRYRKKRKKPTINQ